MNIELKKTDNEILRVKSGPIKIEDSSTTDGCTMRYNPTTKTIDFIF